MAEEKLSGQTIKPTPLLLTDLIHTVDKTTVPLVPASWAITWQTAKDLINDNIYTVNGTLTGARQVDQNGNQISFIKGQFVIGTSVFSGTPNSVAERLFVGNYGDGSADASADLDTTTDLATARAGAKRNVHLHHEKATGGTAADIIGSSVEAALVYNNITLKTVSVRNIKIELLHSVNITANTPNFTIISNVAVAGSAFTAAAKLHIKSTTGTALRIDTSGIGDNSFSVNDVGNIGIGDAPSAGAMLIRAIRSSNNEAAWIFLQNTGSGNAAEVLNSVYSDVAGLTMYSYSSGYSTIGGITANTVRISNRSGASKFNLNTVSCDLVFTTGVNSNTELMRLTQSGRLGIGEPSPFSIVNIVRAGNDEQTWVFLKNSNAGNAAQTFYTAYSDTAGINMASWSSGWTTSGNVTANTVGIYSRPGTSKMLFFNVDSVPFVWAVGANAANIRMTLYAAGGLSLPSLPAGNGGLATGDLYIDTAANILANGDMVVGWKV